MSLYSQFKTDDGLEKTGVLIEYGTNAEGLPICIRIARAGGANKAYEKRLEAEIKPYRRMIHNESIEKGLIDRLLQKVFSETVVLGWENVQDEDGNDIPFNAKNCVKLFEDLPDLFRDIQEQAQRAALFRTDINEADAKN